MQPDEDINLLAVVVDTNPAAWAAAASDPDRPLDFVKIIEQLLIFINAHLSLKFDNELAIIASHTDQSQFLYPLPPADPLGAADDEPSKPANVYKQFFDVDRAVVSKLKELVDDTRSNSVDHENRSMVAGSLALALSYINRIKRANENNTVQSRILILSISPDLPSQYIPTMNCIFAAQKVSTRIDVCRFSGRTYGGESVFLPQASHITAGIYLDIPEPNNLLQYLLYTFLPEPSMRKTLLLPHKDQVDFRAACFCHKNVVDVGYVCSVCLSIFCSLSKKCPTCQTVFQNPSNPESREILTL
ncbi:RNA polymerase II transcription factor B subunit 4 [Geranomyces variabilis]|nr:RNA polymerase II transcription factor B subunit 4 [Geranomyces variabilis]